MPRHARYDVRLRPAELLGRARAFVGRPGRVVRPLLPRVDPRLRHGRRRRPRASVATLLTAKFAEDPAHRPAADQRQRARRCRSCTTAGGSGTATSSPRPRCRALRTSSRTSTRVIQNNPDIDDSEPAELPRGAQQRRRRHADRRLRLVPELLAAGVRRRARPGRQAVGGHRRRRARGVLAVAALPPAARGAADGRRRAADDGEGLVASARSSGGSAIPERSRLGTPCRSGIPRRADWVAFPHPLLTPPDPVPRLNDWLPAVLESMPPGDRAGRTSAPVMASVRPYQLLRELYDDAREPAHERDPGRCPARISCSDWLHRRRHAARRRVARARAAAVHRRPTSGPAAVDQWLAQIGDLVRRQYLRRQARRWRPASVDDPPQAGVGGTDDPRRRAGRRHRDRGAARAAWRGWRAERRPTSDGPV